MIPADELAETLDPYIADAPKARVLLEARKSQAKASKGFGAGGLLSLGIASILGGVMQAEWRDPLSRRNSLTKSLEGDVALLSSFLARL